MPGPTHSLGHTLDLVIKWSQYLYNRQPQYLYNLIWSFICVLWCVCPHAFRTDLWPWERETHDLTSALFKQALSKTLSCLICCNWLQHYNWKERKTMLLECIYCSPPIRESLSLRKAGKKHNVNGSNVCVLLPLCIGTFEFNSNTDWLQGYSIQI